MIALDVAARHRAGPTSEIVFTFVEERQDRAERLRREITNLALPSNFKVRVLNEEFQTALGMVLDSLETKGLTLAPTFAFVDPFGVKGLPLSLISRLLAHPKCEVLITFMESSIRRFVTEMPEHVNDLIGNPSAADQIIASANRVVEARTLYERSLRTVAKYVRFFQMRDSANNPIYDLFFGSNHERGHYKMKEAMWKVNDSGEFAFSDGINPEQTVLFSSDPGREYAPLLWRTFRGQTVYTDQIFRYTRNESPYLDKHARAAMSILEAGSGGECACEAAPAKRDGTKRKRGSYPLGLRITFSD